MSAGRSLAGAMVGPRIAFENLDKKCDYPLIMIEKSDDGATRLPRTTLEQWAVLRVVVDTGGFAQAAASLHRSQSAISYAIARLQERLDVPLLEIHGRRAVLTDAGRALLAQAVPLIDDLVRLEERGRAIGNGEDIRIRLLVDSLFPKPRMFQALQQLARAYPHVEIEVEETVRQTAPVALHHPFDLAIAIPDTDSRGSQRIAEIELVAVAHRDHVLHGRPAPLSAATLARQLRIDIQGVGHGLHEANAEHRVWRVSTVEAAVAAVTQGLCFGWLPRSLIEEQLASGLLVPLLLQSGGKRLISLDLSFGDAERAGPATHALARLLCGDG